MSIRSCIGTLVCAASIMFGGPCVAVEHLYQCDDLARRAEVTELNSKVYQGDAGWFFRDTDLNHFYMMSPHTQRFLTRLRDVLASHSTTLVLMPLPPKSVLEPDHARAATMDGDVLFDPDFARSQFAEMLTRLKADQIVVADVLATLSSANHTSPGDFYFARDIHWRPKLAELSADAVRDALIAAKVDVFGDKTFVTRSVGEGANESNTNTVFNQLCAEQIPGETMEIFVTEAADQSVDSFLAGESEPPPLHVVGTSFTDEAKAFNFSGFLRQAISNDVATYSVSGGGIDTALYQWAAEGIATEGGAKALVWEMPYPERLEPLAAAIEREIIPAIVGLCATADVVQAMPYELGPDGSVTLTLDPGIKASGDGYYVTATLSDPTLRAAALTFDYRDGRQDVLPIIRPERVASAANIFGQLTSLVSSDLNAVTLENRTATPVSGTFSLCRYPSGLWPAAS